MSPSDLADVRGDLERGRFREALGMLAIDGPVSPQSELLRASCLAGLGRYEESLAVLGELTSDEKLSADPRTGAEALIGRSELLVRLGQSREALSQLSRVFDLPPVAELAPRLFTGLANAYTELGDMQRAEDMSDFAARTLSETYGGPFADPVAYQLTADRKLAIARLAAATRRHRRALYVLEGIEIEGDFGSGSSLVDESSQARYAALREGFMPEVDLQAGDSLLAIGNIAGAAERYLRARAAGRARGDVAIEIDAAAGEGMAALRGGDERRALEHLRAAAALAERWRSTYQAEDHRIGLRERQARLYDSLIETAVALRDSSLTWEFVERARAREFLLALQRGTTRPLDVDATDGRLGRLSAEIQELTASMTSVSVPDRAVGELREHREMLLEEKGRAVRELRAQHRLGAEITEPRVARVDEVAAFLDEDTAFVQYHTTASAAIAMVVTGDGVTLVRLPCSLASLTRRVALQLQLVASPSQPSPTGETWQEVGAHLHGWLWEPIQRHIAGRRRVCVAAHGPLHALPFATIGRDEPLLARHELMQVPSAGVMVALGDRPARRVRTVAVLANPMMDLPGATTEAAAIAATELDVRIHAGPGATGARFRAAANSVDVLHLACHASFDASRPLLSALMLAPDGDDGRVEAHEIYRTDIAASIVVLSACDSGRADASAASELEGLVRAFMAAGASAVIGSQWLVDDAAAALTMESMYWALASGIPVGQALHDAQLALAQRKGFDHPYFWAPFLLYGRWW